MGLPNWLQWLYNNSPYQGIGNKISTSLGASNGAFQSAIDTGWEEITKPVGSNQIAKTDPATGETKIDLKGQPFSNELIGGQIANNIVAGKTISQAGTDSYLGGHPEAAGVIANSTSAAKELGALNGMSGEDILLNLYNQTKDYSWLEKIAENRIASQNTAAAREWEKMMSDTAFSRSVADIKAAGLNPWLALQNGNAASTPSVSAADLGSTNSSSQATSRANAKTDLISKIVQALLVLGLASGAGRKL